MSPLRLHRAQLPIDDIADEGVDEAQRRPGLQDLGPQQGADRRLEPIDVQAGDGLEHRNALPVTDHGERPRNGDGVRARVRKPDQHGARHGPRPEGRDQLDRGRIRCHPVGLHGTGQFVEQQGFPPVARRQSAANSSAGSASIRRRKTSATASTVSGCGSTISVAASPISSARAASPVGCSCRAKPAEHDHRQPIEPPTQVRQKAQRRTVAQLQVVDRQQHRPIRGWH